MSGKECFFVIESSADGIRISQYTQQGLEDWLNDVEDVYVDGYIQRNYRFLAALKREDPNEWGGEKPCTALIIKGEIVVPRPVEIVEKYKLQSRG